MSPGRVLAVFVHARYVALDVDQTRHFFSDEPLGLGACLLRSQQGVALFLLGFAGVALLLGLFGFRCLDARSAFREGVAPRVVERVERKARLIELLAV